MARGSETRFSSRAVYQVLSLHSCTDLDSTEIWASRLSSKIKVFTRLLTVDHLSTRVKLRAKSCPHPTPSCESCGADETIDHLFIACARASEVWRRLNMGSIRCVSEVLQCATSVVLQKATTTFLSGVGGSAIKGVVSCWSSVPCSLPLLSVRSRFFLSLLDPWGLV
ncbi:hypothetical protein D1007_61191 [Hordeum vulgare]|nr:hypothetical protein D1007_61191 [Hordeum vulgare]